jgi:hypothetical protein
MVQWREIKARVTRNVRKLIPYRANPLLRRLRRRIAKPTLPYVELHLTDHCNLNCRGCGHFSSIAEPWFADITAHDNDMKQLAKLFSNIEDIRLMGGEPLLHPMVTSFFASTRQHFPHSAIHLVTNGLLLPKMRDDFWKSCHEHRIIIDLTVYPPTAKDIDDMREKADQWSIEVRSYIVRKFHAQLNLAGDSDPAKAMRTCRSRYYCPFLRNGRLYTCSLPATAHYFNECFGTAIPDVGYVDIFAKKMTGWKCIELLNQPSSACHFCSCDYAEFEWQRSHRAKEEWDAQWYNASSGQQSTTIVSCREDVKG